MKNDPVDYAGEINTILKILDSAHKEIKVHIECATGDHLAKFLKQTPKVLHVSCHGDMDKETNEYFLEFENHKAELFKLTPTIIRKLFKGEDLSEIEIMFVNACHSEAVAKTFMELGVKSLIVVEGETKIDDTYAKEFSQLFYLELLDSKTISQAFESAII